MNEPVLSPLGDRVISVSFGEGISDELSSHVVGRSSEIRAAAIIGVTDVVPSYAALAVFYDPLVIGYADLSERISSLISLRDSARPAADDATLHIIEVRYDGEDIEEVATRTGLSIDEVISIHSEPEYRAYVIGFVPGFAYLGTIDERLSLPRRESPRKRVPPGSVAIADRQTGIYPASTPGGWNLIGTTSAILFDPNREQPALFKAGDRVRFEPC
ncbi:MAG: 5-oxoprolinase subunit PxpB [Gemmatimonadaceae bacterium]